MRGVIAVTCATALLGLGGGLLAAPRQRTIWDGVYTEAQATAGAARYAQQCARCHGAELYGTAEIPSLRGQLIGRWGHASLGQLFDYVHKAMPMQAPGALPPAADAEILAYMLKVNGAPAGTEPLPDDPARSAGIAITGRPRLNPGVTP